MIPSKWESLKEEDKPQEVHATPLCAPHYLQAEMPPSVSTGGEAPIQMLQNVRGS